VVRRFFQTTVTLALSALCAAPLVAQVRAEVEREVNAAAEARIAALDKEHQARLAAARGDVQAELMQRVHTRLLVLAGHMRGGRDG